MKPGDVVVTSFQLYQHWSIVSDRIGDDGEWMLISATRRTGTVAEERFFDVTDGNRTYVADVDYECSRYEVLERARSQVGLWQYSVHSRNCEHFVNFALTGNRRSRQVSAVLSGAASGAALAARTRMPIWGIVAAGVIGGAASLRGSRPKKQKKGR